MDQKLASLPEVHFMQTAIQLACQKAACRGEGSLWGRRQPVGERAAFGGKGSLLAEGSERGQPTWSMVILGLLGVLVGLLGEAQVSGDQQQGMGAGQRALTHVQLRLPSCDFLKQDDGALHGGALRGVWHGQLAIDGARMNSNLYTMRWRSYPQGVCYLG